VNFFAPQGLYHIGEKGYKEVIGVQLEIEYQAIDLNNNPVGTVFYKTQALFGNIRKISSSVGLTLTGELAASSRMRYRLRRTTVHTSRGTVVDEVQAKSVYVVSKLNKLQYEDVTLVRSVTITNDITAGIKEREMNMLVTRRLPLNGTGSLTATKSAAQALINIALDQKNGRMNLSEIDVAQILAEEQAVIDYFGNPKAAEFSYTFDDNNLSFEEMAGMVASTMFCEAYRYGSKLRTRFEKPQDTVITFPKVKGVWRVRHQGTAGFKIQLKTLDSADPLIELTNGQFIDVVSDAVNLYLIDKQNQVGKHKGEFKNLATYNMNDIVEHGSGRYKTVAAVATNQINPIDNYRFEKIGNKPINNKTISVVSETAQAINGTTVRRIISTSKDGSTVFSNQPYAQITESKDFGLTWTKILDLPAAEASLIEQMDNGELILFVTESGPTSNLVRRIYTTVGYGTDSVQLVSRLMSQRDKNYFGGNWGFDAYKNIILTTEYGSKYKSDANPADLSWTNVVGGNARYVWLSLDYGKTWKVIFDLNTKTDGIGVHTHSAVYDHYWNRIWVHHGDGATGRNGMYYSDDLGVTWVYALQGNAAGANFPQATCTVVLPDCILFGSDSAPNGVYRLDRSQGKQPYKGYYALETAWKHPETSDTLLNAVCYKLAHSRHAPDMPYIFAFAPESNPTKGVIVATYDGYSFFKLWQDSTTRTVGNGVRHVVGVTLQNEVIARVQDDRFGVGVQTELRLKVV